MNAARFLAESCGNLCCAIELKRCFEPPEVTQAAAASAGAPAHDSPWRACALPAARPAPGLPRPQPPACTSSPRATLHRAGSPPVSRVGRHTDPPARGRSCRRASRGRVQVAARPDAVEPPRPAPPGSLPTVHAAVSASIMRDPASVSSAYGGWSREDQRGSGWLRGDEQRSHLPKTQLLSPASRQKHADVAHAPALMSTSTSSMQPRSRPKQWPPSESWLQTLTAVRPYLSTSGRPSLAAAD